MQQCLFSMFCPKMESNQFCCQINPFPSMDLILDLMPLLAVKILFSAEVERDSTYRDKVQ